MDRLNSMGDSQMLDGLFPEKVMFAHQASDALPRLRCANANVISATLHPPGLRR